MTERVLILDFGSQYTQLIARRLREQHVYCEIHPCTVPDDVRARLRVRRRSSSPAGRPRLTSAESPRAPEAVFELGVPVLGICYGEQTMCAQLGGRSSSRRTGASTAGPMHRSPTAPRRCSTASWRRASRRRSG